MTALSYVVVTPARNEAQFIESTITSMIAQSVRPVRWVIVSDGSTDGTDDIVRRHSSVHDWIELVRMPERRERHFAGKVGAFHAGYDRVRDIPHDVVVSMDADISFGEDYFAFLIGKLASDPALGLVGTPFEEAGSTYDYRFVSIEHVSGACQVFRRKCFEDIGGYRPLQSGGIDLVAVLSAQAAGWKTRTFTERTCSHHRVMGTAHRVGIKAGLHRGHMDYLLGCHPFWQFCRAIYQMQKPPVFVGGLMLFVGYSWAMVRRVPPTMPAPLIALRRREQMHRLRTVARRILTVGTT